jgi:hypothetical protein
MHAAPNPIPGLHRNNGQQVWRYKEQLRLRRKVPCGTSTTRKYSARSTAVDRCFVSQNSLHSQSQAKAGVGRGCHFPLSFRCRKSAPHNGRIGSAFEAMPFLRGPGTGSANGGRHAPPERARGRDLKEPPVWARRRRQLRRHGGAAPSRYAGVVWLAFLDAPSRHVLKSNRSRPACADLAGQKLREN